MTSYENNFISAARSGGSAYVLLCSTIAAAQSPGARYQRFSAEVYLVIMGCILALAPLAYFAIERNQLGLRADVDSSKISEATSEVEQEGRQVEKGECGVEDQINPMVASSTNYSVEASAAATGKKESATASSAGGAGAGVIGRSARFEIEEPGAAQDAEVTVGAEKHDDSAVVSTEVIIDLKACGLWRPYFLVDLENYIEGIMRRVSCFIIWDSLAVKYPWARRAVPYILLLAWCNFNTWGVTSAIFPFAVFNAYGGSSSAAGILGIGYQVGGVCLVLGDLSHNGATLGPVLRQHSLHRALLCSLRGRRQCPGVLHRSWRPHADPGVLRRAVLRGKHRHLHLPHHRHRVSRTGPAVHIADCGPVRTGCHFYRGSARHHHRQLRRFVLRLH